MTSYTRSSCAHCEARAGLYLADCRGCAARAIAQSPQHFEAKRTGKQTQAYRDRLAAAGLTHDEVKAAANAEVTR